MFKHKKITVNGKEYYQTICRNKNETVYYLNGKVHREDGPAIEYNDGYKYWWINGKRHRDGGPAVEYPNGYKEWWLDGKIYSKEEHKKLCMNIKK